MTGPSASERAKRFVLVVMNDICDRFAVSMLLQLFGCTSCGIGSTGEALEFLDVVPPAAVVSDGGAAGAALVEGIRRSGRFAGLPVLLVDSGPDRAAEDLALRGEVAAVLRKPLDPGDLYRAVQACMEKNPRSHMRIATSLPAELRDGGPGSKGIVTALSEHGMFFRTLEPRVRHARLPVLVALRGGPVTLEAEVLYVSRFSEGPFREPGMGMKFVAASDEARLLIRSFIADQVGGKRKNGAPPPC